MYKPWLSRTLAQPDMQIWDVICSKRLTIIQRWKTGNTCLNQFALLSALLQFAPEFCGKKMYQQYKEYESATWAMKNSEKRWAVFDRVCGLHCSWCKSSQMKLKLTSKWNVQECHTQVKVSIFSSFLSFFCVTVAKIFEGKTSMFLLLVTHVQDGVILCLPFTIFNKFLKIPNPFPQTKLCMVWKIVKSSIAFLNLTKFWTKAHAQNCRYFSPTVSRSTREP